MQNVASEDSGRVWRPHPAQTATIFYSALKKIPHSRAECCHGGFRADWSPFSRAGGYIFLFRAEKDTPFPRRTSSPSIPGGLGTVFPRRLLQFPIPRRKRYSIPAQNITLKASARKMQRNSAQNVQSAVPWAALARFSRLYSFVSRQVLVSLQIQFLSYVKTDVFGSCSGQFYLCRQGFQI